MKNVKWSSTTYYDSRECVIRALLRRAGRGNEEREEGRGKRRAVSSTTGSTTTGTVTGLLFLRPLSREREARTADCGGSRVQKDLSLKLEREM
jgi:hypothetical protein